MSINPQKIINAKKVGLLERLVDQLKRKRDLLQNRNQLLLDLEQSLEQTIQENAAKLDQLEREVQAAQLRQKLNLPTTQN